MKKLVVAIFAVGVLLASCGKYDEGPGISFRSKKARIVGDWILAKVIENGIEEPLDADDKDDVYTFKKDGTYEFMDPGNATETGTWSFNSDKSSLSLTDPSVGFSFEGKILRLTNKEMWLEYAFFGQKTEIHYEAK